MVRAVIQIFSEKCKSIKEGCLWCASGKIFLEEMTLELNIKEEEEDGEPDEVGSRVKKRGENTF